MAIVLSETETGWSVQVEVEPKEAVVLILGDDIFELTAEEAEAVGVALISAGMDLTEEEQ